MPPSPTALRARELRASATEAERRLWGALRGKRLAGLKWRRQMPVGPYFADFACPAIRLIVELDGSQHGERTAEDERRTAWLMRQGWRVLRIWNGEVFQNMDGVCRALLEFGQAGRTSEARRPTPHPLP